MRYVQYAGPSDTFDVSNVLGKPGMVFHTPTNERVPADMRGNVIQVTNEAWEELQTYPNHNFVEVSDDDAKVLIAAQTKARTNREQLAALRAAHEAPSAMPPMAAQLAALPVVTEVEIATATTRPAAEIRRETQAEAKRTADATVKE